MFPESNKVSSGEVEKYKSEASVSSEKILNEAFRQITEYFNAKRHKFDLPIDITGTPFQMGVWQALRSIPYGKVVSYGMIAEYIGNPKAVRAVGMANNKNPIAIIIPCHRVLGKDGHLTGFGSGMDVKQKLLELEGHQVNSMKIMGVHSWAQSIG
ncbi:MAG: methylated-DNA--[protein]-cysteine S-methyltransferase [Tindallia sp. MSAO_Bac2]|nr:MAG: methylated-DNA--[protein]-cysteine S-methyltransferase [Tindallia sp. MSAO_Bac2]